MRVGMEDLPPDLRGRLLELSRGKPLAGHTAQRLEGPILKVFAILIGLGAAAGSIGHAITWGYPMKEKDVAPVHALILFGGALFVTVGVFRLIGLLRSRMRPAAIRAPGFLFFTGRDRDPVEIRELPSTPPTPEYVAWNAALAAKPPAPERSRLRTFAALLLACVFSAAVTAVAFVPVWILNVRVAEESEWRQAQQGSWVSERSAYVPDAQGFQRYVDWELWFVELPAFVRQRTEIDAHLATARERVDDFTFAAAHTAAALRAYRKDFAAKGRHLVEARAALHQIYVDIEAAYLAQAKEAGAAPQAAEGMTALLAYLRESDDPTVRIVFLPVAGLDGDVIEKETRAQTGSDLVQPIGPSFSAGRNRSRESRIAGAMDAALARVFPEDMLDLDPQSKSMTGPRFLVRYEVLPSGSFYTLTSEDELPLAKRHVYPGIVLSFDFTLQVPAPGSAIEAEDDPAKGYRYSMVARPALDFSVSSRAGAQPEPTAVYDRMAETAFIEFESSLARAYGVGAGVALEKAERPGK